MAFAYQNPLFIFFFLAILLSSTHAIRHQTQNSETPVDPMAREFQNWTAKFNREYDSSREYEYRFKIWKANVKYIEEWSTSSSTYEMAANSLADRRTDEVMVPNELAKSETIRDLTAFRYDNVGMVPPSIDWREKGAVTPVKDQGEGACCWAFCAVGALESLHQIRTGELISLSEQELVDCDQPDGACNATGLMTRAFAFLTQKGGIASESLYPYTAQGGSCDKQKSSIIAGYEVVPQNNESALLTAVASQPVKVVFASHRNFQLYGGGIYNGPCNSEINHGLLLVGYGTNEEGVPYWIVKNSWGTNWIRQDIPKCYRYARPVWCSPYALISSRLRECEEIP